MKLFDLPLNRQLDRALRGTSRNIHVSGSTSPVLLSQMLTYQYLESPSTHLVILPNDEAVDKLENDLDFFEFPHPVYRLPSFDMSPYSGLYPNPKNISLRLKFLNAALSNEAALFLTTVESLSQKTIPVEVLKENQIKIQVGSEVSPDFGKQLAQLGYAAAPSVEDYGQYAIRGGIIDVFSPAHDHPFRIELFGDEIESLRFFDQATQRSLSEANEVKVLPAREVLFSDQSRMSAAKFVRESAQERKEHNVDAEAILHDLTLGRYFYGVEYLLGSFYESPSLPIEFFNSEMTAWKIDPPEIAHNLDSVASALREDKKDANSNPICPEIDSLYDFENYSQSKSISTNVVLSDVLIEDESETNEERITLEYACHNIANQLKGLKQTGDLEDLFQKVSAWNEDNYRIFVSTHTQSQAQRLAGLFKQNGYSDINIIDTNREHWSWSIGDSHDDASEKINIIPKTLSTSMRDPSARFIFLREEDFFGKKSKTHAAKRKQTESRTSSLAFGELNPGDKIVHLDHGVALYEGLKVMDFAGIQSEFLQLNFRDDDKLYLPVYRIGQIQKYSGIGGLDKLGGTQWEKTKVKVKAQLRDIADDLLKLYAQRAQVTREPYKEPDGEYKKFEAFFPYEETDDQLLAIDSILEDLGKEKPMDRLICGDVGFGKTEVALRAAFRVAQEGKQVAVLVPTTILAFQHFETFTKRFNKWPMTVRALSRFTPTKDAKQTVQELKDGKVNVIIGTHRLLSKDVGIPNLGLLIIDEEQRFGVSQKEQIRRIKANVDTISMSATPIPRTLNMSLMGLRDLSLINTAPKNRLPTRTFLAKKNPETIRKAILAEINRGGQVFYVHNRVQSIFDEATELRNLVPEARIQVGHGKMSERDLEKTMLAFFKHEFDVLISTTIIESGIDIPRANTMIVDHAEKFGLSQLYQLRGRIGRSSERAYCYLMLPQSGMIDPVAQDRLKTLQEHSDLGSGITIAQHDLELRGAGNLLGEAQAGHVEAVGYELYLELLEDAIKQAKGEPVEAAIEPDINIQIPALIPDKYIPDIRVRLAFYRKLSKINSVEEVDDIEEELRDQFGAPPEPVLNLLGVMIIRYFCKVLGIKDLSTGPKNLNLSFTDKPKIPAEKVIELATTQSKKYQITPDNRLLCRLEKMDWPTIYEELVHLHSLA